MLIDELSFELPSRLQVRWSGTTRSLLGGKHSVTFRRQRTLQGCFNEEVEFCDIEFENKDIILQRWK